MAPNVKKSEFYETDYFFDNNSETDLLCRDENSKNSFAVSFEDRLIILRIVGLFKISVSFSRNAFNYHAYPRFAALIAYNGEKIEPKQKSLSWLMRTIEDLYDSRFLQEKFDAKIYIDIVDESELSHTKEFDLCTLIFPIFVLKTLGSNTGLRTIVDQICWDLLYSLHVYREEFLEVEVFARFLQEYYDQSDLMFFLYARSMLVKHLHFNFKSRWLHGPVSTNKDNSSNIGDSRKNLFLTYKECSYITKMIYGGDNDDLHKEFMSLLITNTSHQSPIQSPNATRITPTKSPSSDNRNVYVYEYLHLSVLFYHDHVKSNFMTTSPQSEFVALPDQTCLNSNIPESPYDGVFNLNYVPPTPTLDDINEYKSKIRNRKERNLSKLKVTINRSSTLESKVSDSSPSQKKNGRYDIQLDESASEGNIGRFNQLIVY